MRPGHEAQVCEPRMVIAGFRPLLATVPSQSLVLVCRQCHVSFVRFPAHVHMPWLTMHTLLTPTSGTLNVSAVDPDIQPLNIWRKLRTSFRHESPAEGCCTCRTSSSSACHSVLRLTVQSSIRTLLLSLTFLLSLLYPQPIVSTTTLIPHLPIQHAFHSRRCRRHRSCCRSSHPSA